MSFICKAPTVNGENYTKMIYTPFVNEAKPHSGFSAVWILLINMNIVCVEFVYCVGAAWGPLYIYYSNLMMLMMMKLLSSSVVLPHGAKQIKRDRGNQGIRFSKSEDFLCTITISEKSWSFNQSNVLCRNAACGLTCILYFLERHPYWISSLLQPCPW